MTHREEHRQQAAPERRADREVQREVAGIPEPDSRTVKPPTPRTAIAVRSAPHRRAARPCSASTARESMRRGGEQAAKRELRPHDRSRTAQWTPASQPTAVARAEQHGGRHDRPPAAPRAVHPARKTRVQESEKEVRQHGEQHQEAVRPDRRHGEDRVPRSASADLPCEQVQPHQALAASRLAMPEKNMQPVRRAVRLSGGRSGRRVEFTGRTKKRAGAWLAPARGYSRA